MKDVNELIKTLLENAVKFKLSYSNTTVHEKYENHFEVTVDIRISKISENYGLLGGIPEVADMIPQNLRRGGPL